MPVVPVAGVSDREPWDCEGRTETLVDRWEAATEQAAALSDTDLRADGVTARVDVWAAVGVTPRWAELAGGICWVEADFVATGGLS